MARYIEMETSKGLPEESDRRSWSPKVTSCDKGFTNLASRTDTELAERLQACLLRHMKESQVKTHQAP